MVTLPLAASAAPAAVQVKAALLSDAMTGLALAGMRSSSWILKLYPRKPTWQGDGHVKLLVASGAPNLDADARAIALQGGWNSMPPAAISSLAKSMDVAIPLRKSELHLVAFTVLENELAVLPKRESNAKVDLAVTIGVLVEVQVAEVAAMSVQAGHAADWSNAKDLGKVFQESVESWRFGQNIVVHEADLSREWQPGVQPGRSERQLLLQLLKQGAVVLLLAKKAREVEGIIEGASQLCGNVIQKGVARH